MGNYLSMYFGRMYISREDSDWDIAQRSQSQTATKIKEDDNMSQRDPKQSPSHTTEQNLEMPGSSSSPGMKYTNESKAGPSRTSGESAGSGHVTKQCKRYLPESAQQEEQSKCKRLSTQDCRCSQDRDNSPNALFEQHTEESCVPIPRAERNSHIDRFAAVCRHNKKLPAHDNCDMPCCTDRVTCHVSADHMGLDQQDSPIEMLPSVLLVNIFRYLSLADRLHRVSLVCKYWCDLSHDPDLWREINLRGQLRVTDSILQRVVSYSEGVISVDISDARLVSDDGLKALAKQCTGLVCLKMMRCVQLKEAAFIAVGQHCPNLVHLYLDCCFCLSDKALAAISAGCSRIRVLHINQCGLLSNEGIQAVGKGCPDLEDLSMDQCKQIGDAGLMAIIEGCPKLKHLSAMSCVFTSEGITQLVKLPHLQRLELHDVLGVTDECIVEVVKHCKELQTLNLSLCTRITDYSVNYIAKHATSLKSLYLASCDLTNKALFSLGAYSRTLETVDVGWCSNITDDGAVEISKSCSTLRSLGLTRCDKVTIQTMDYLVKKYPHIHYSTFWLDCRRLMTRAQRIGLFSPEQIPT